MTMPQKERFSITECFNGAIKLYAGNPWRFLVFSFAASVPALLKAFLVAGLGQDASIGNVVLQPVVFSVYTFFLMCLIYRIVTFEQGVLLSSQEVMAYVLTRLLRGVGGYLLYVFGTIAGILLFILPGIYCGTVFCFFIFVIFAEDRGLIDSFKRSHELVQVHFWKVLVVHTMTLFVTAVVFLSVIIGMRIVGADAMVIEMAITILGAVTMPVVSGFYYFIYLALKKEKDGVINIAVSAS